MRYKLDMLEPAVKVFRVIFVLSVVSAVLYVFKQRGLALAFTGVAVELKQDNYLVNRYYKLRNEAKILGDSYECEYCGSRFKMKSSFCPLRGKSLKT